MATLQVCGLQRYYSGYQTCDTAECCCGYHAINHHNFGSESVSLHTQNDNLGDSLMYLNTVVTPETLQFVCGLYIILEVCLGTVWAPAPWLRTTLKVYVYVCLCLDYCQAACRDPAEGHV